LTEKRIKFQILIDRKTYQISNFNWPQNVQYLTSEGLKIRIPNL